jgi:outer membrane protein assembly factor BamD
MKTIRTSTLAPFRRVAAGPSEPAGSGWPARASSRRLSAGLAGTVLAVLLASLCFTTGCLFFGGKKAAPPAVNGSVAPDKLLYDRGTTDIHHGKYTEGRLTLQTLINTYPDSEYLAKAKLAIADSYYKEGGTSGLTQAIAEYQDFVTFFPFLDEAAYAQMQVAMGHYRMMEKPDRDRTQALQAEDAFQTMILKYPKSKWTPEATQRLRDVQEVLAQGDYDVARFYDIRMAYKAAAARLLELTARYPLFSQADKADWMLGEIYERAERNDFAADFYGRIVRDYPLSDLVPEAKKKLQQIGYPVPQPDPAALARMQAEQQYEQTHSGKEGMFRRAIDMPLGMLHGGPNVSHAAHYGQPDLQPESVEVSPTEVLEPGGGMTAGAAGNGSGGGATTNAVSVQRVGEASAAGAPPAAAGGAGNSAAAAGGTADASAAPASDSPAQLAKGPQPQKKGKKVKDSTSKKKKGWHKIIPW